MRSGEVRWLATAEDDLDTLFRYVALESGSLATALGYIDRIIEKCDKLALFPLSGRSQSEYSPGLRSTPFERLMIFYRAEDRGIAVLRVVNAARDYRVLFELDD